MSDDRPAGGDRSRGRSPGDADRGAPDGGAPAPEGHAPPAPPVDPEYGETWVYESIVEALPGVDISERLAVAIQFVGFQSLAVVLAAGYGRWEALPAATAAIVVATGGSVLMQRMAHDIRKVEVPEPYRRALLGSSIEVVLGILAFLALVTYLFVLDPRGAVGSVPLRTADQPLLESLLGERPPAPAVYLALLVLWDVCYRIGTGWWAAVVAAWRSYRYDFDPPTAHRLRAVDRLNLGFGLLQLLLVPFLWGHPVLLVAVVGHVAAVLLVAGYALVTLR